MIHVNMVRLKQPPLRRSLSEHVVTPSLRTRDLLYHRNQLVMTLFGQVSRACSFFKQSDLRQRRSITMVRSLARDSWSCPGLPTQV